MEFGNSVCGPTTGGRKLCVGKNAPQHRQLVVVATSKSKQKAPRQVALRPSGTVDDLSYFLLLALGAAGLLALAAAFGTSFLAGFVVDAFLLGFSAKRADLPSSA